MAVQQRSTAQAKQFSLVESILAFCSICHFILIGKQLLPYLNLKVYSRFNNQRIRSSSTGYFSPGTTEVHWYEIPSPSGQYPIWK